jgi:hypothetical protein
MDCEHDDIVFDEPVAGDMARCAERHEELTDIWPVGIDWPQPRELL